MRTRNERRRYLLEKVGYWSARLEASPRVLRVQRMTRKWGSCSTRGVVTLAEDLADQDLAFQDYVIAHELLHLRVPNHGRVFKALMNIHVPNWRELAGAQGRSCVLRRRGEITTTDENELQRRLESVARDIILGIAQLLVAIDKAIQAQHNFCSNELTPRERDSQRLGELGWTVPIWVGINAPSRLRSKSAAEIDSIFVEAYSINGSARYQEMLKDLVTADGLEKWKALILECDFAFRNEKYRIVVPSLLTILDGFLASLVGQLGRSTRPIEIVSRHLRPGLTGTVLASVRGFVSRVYADHHFSADRNPLINRHWILHGRDDTEWTRADCLRLFQALDTMSRLRNPVFADVAVRGG